MSRSPGPPQAPTLTPGALRSALLAIDRPKAGPGLAVAAIDRGSAIAAAVGSADPAGRAMTPDTPVRVASLTKTFTAASVLRLWETGRLDLDAPLATLIAPRHDAMLRSGGYETAAITPRHLLSHAGGLADHFGSDGFTATVLADPSRVWTRTDQIAAMLSTSVPAGRPGERFRYSDTGYLLLGEIVERLAAAPLGRAVRTLLRWEAPGLRAIRWEGEAPACGPDRAHQWMDGLDTTAIHGSVDAFGGGGMIASVRATARAYDALFAGRTFDRAVSLERMLTAPGAPPRSPCRMGLFADRLNGVAVFRHGGFWGLEALAVPERGLVVVAAALDRAWADDVRRLVDDVAAQVLATR